MGQNLQMRRFHDCFAVSMPLTSWVTLDMLFNLSGPLFCLICKMELSTHLPGGMESTNEWRTEVVLGRLYQTLWTSEETCATI